MKLLSKNLLLEYGFTESEVKSNKINQVMTRNNFDIIIKDGKTFHHSDMGVDYLLKDIAALRKLYKEIKSEELKPVK
jgi:hypothetical protein